MALPLLTFPLWAAGESWLFADAGDHAGSYRGQTARLTALLDRMLRLTGYLLGAGGALFWVWGGRWHSCSQSPEAGFYLETLAQPCR